MAAQFVVEMHPSESVLEEFLFGRLSPGASQALKAHCSGCLQCREALIEASEFILLAKLVLSQDVTDRERVQVRAAQ